MACVFCSQGPPVGEASAGALGWGRGAGFEAGAAEGRGLPVASQVCPLRPAGQVGPAPPSRHPPGRPADQLRHLGWGTGPAPGPRSGGSLAGRCGHRLCSAREPAVGRDSCAGPGRDSCQVGTPGTLPPTSQSYCPGSSRRGSRAHPKGRGQSRGFLRSGEGSWVPTPPPPGQLRVQDRPCRWRSACLGEGQWGSVWCRGAYPGGVGPHPCILGFSLVLSCP